MEARIEICWSCPPCEVGGRDTQRTDIDPACWNCGGPVVVTARPTLPSGGDPGTR
ncbi:hypothetical protein [Blastococcus sp. SYSU D01042]